MSEVNLMDQFGGAIESYEEASARIAAEEAARGGSKLKMFKVPNGESRIRLIVLHPESPVKGFTFPVAQFFMPINIPGQSKPRYVKTLRATDNGFDKDLLVEFRKLATVQIDSMIEGAKGAKKKELETIKENFGKSSYNDNVDSLMFDFKQVAYCLNMEDEKTRAEGWQVVEFSNKQAGDLKTTVKKLWDKRVKKEQGWAEDNNKTPRPNKMICPVTHPSAAFPVEIDKSGKPVTYKFTIDNDEDEIISLTEAEIKSFFEVEPIHKAYTGYNRYQFGGTLAFIDQFDARLGLGVYSSDEFQEIVKLVESQLDPADDQEFKLEAKSGKAGDSPAGGEDAVDGLLLDDLLDEFDDLVEDGIKEGSDEMNDFKAKLRKYISQEGLTIKVGRRKTAADAVQEIEEAIDAAGGERGVASADGDDVGTEVDNSPETETETETETVSEPEEEEEQQEEVQEEAPTRTRRTSTRTGARAGRTARTKR